MHRLLWVLYLCGPTVPKPVLCPIALTSLL